MPPTTAYRFGDVVLVPFPFTDQTATKKRPAVVVNSAPYSQSRLDVILMAITSQMKPGPAFGDVSIAHWKQAGLIKPGIIKAVITTAEKRLVIKRLGRLQPVDEKALRQTLQSILG